MVVVDHNQSRHGRWVPIFYCLWLVCVGVAEKIKVYRTSSNDRNNHSPNSPDNRTMCSSNNQEVVHIEVGVPHQRMKRLTDPAIDQLCLHLPVCRLDGNIPHQCPAPHPSHPGFQVLHPQTRTWNGVEHKLFYLG